MSDYAAATESDRELERCRRLVDASYALHTTLDLDELLGLILETAKAGVDADRGTVFLISADGTALWSRVITGAGNLEIRLPMGQGIAGSVRVHDRFRLRRRNRSSPRHRSCRTGLSPYMAGNRGRQDKNFKAILQFHFG